MHTQYSSRTHTHTRTRMHSAITTPHDVYRSENFVRYYAYMSIPVDSQGRSIHRSSSETIISRLPEASATYPAVETDSDVSDDETLVADMSFNVSFGNDDTDSDDCQSSISSDEEEAVEEADEEDIDPLFYNEAWVGASDIPDNLGSVQRAALVDALFNNDSDDENNVTNEVNREASIAPVIPYADSSDWTLHENILEARNFVRPLVMRPRTEQYSVDRYPFRFENNDVADMQNENEAENSDVADIRDENEACARVVPYNRDENESCARVVPYNRDENKAAASVAAARQGDSEDADDIRTLVDNLSDAEDLNARLVTFGDVLGKRNGTGSGTPSQTSLSSPINPSKRFRHDHGDSVQ